MSSGSPAPAPPGLVALSGAATGSGGGGSPPVEWGSGVGGRRLAPFVTHTVLWTAAGDDPMGRWGSTDIADGGQSRNQPSRSDGRRRGRTPCCRPLPETTRWAAGEVRTSPTADRAGTNRPAATDDAEDTHHAVDRCRDDPVGRWGSADTADDRQSRNQPSRSDGRRRGRTPGCRPLPETTRWAAAEVRTPPTTDRAGTNPPAATDDAEDAHRAVDRCRRRPDGPLRKYGHRRRQTEPEPTLPQRRTTPRRPVCGSRNSATATHRAIN